MASTAKARADAGVTEEAKAEWWRLFNNGVSVDDGDGNEEEEEEAVEEGERGGAERRATYAVARYGTAAETAARGVKAEMVARGGGGKAVTEAAVVGGKRRSSPRFADPAALDEEISGGNNYLQPAEVPRRRKKAIAKRTRLNVNGSEVQNSISQAHSSPPVITGPELVCEDNQNLKLQLALKTAEFKQEENRRLKLELILLSNETESMQKQIGDLKAENEQLRKNVKPERIKRKCRSCNARVFHDYRNCPKRLKGASSPEKEDEEEDGEEPKKVRRHCRSCDDYVMHDYRNCPKRREAASSPEEENGEDSY